MTNFISTKTTDNGEVATIPCFITKTKIYEFKKTSHCNITVEQDKNGFTLKREAGKKEIKGLRSDEMFNELGEFFNGIAIVKQAN